VRHTIDDTFDDQIRRRSIRHDRVIIRAVDVVIIRVVDVWSIGVWRLGRTGTRWVP
jgi:hypothetical protein